MAKRNAERRKLLLKEWPIRIGIHSGSVIAGIVGASRMTYDIWGEGANLASRLQENCEAGQINLSEATVGLLGSAFELQARGEVEAKNKGLVKMYYLVSQATD